MKWIVRGLVVAFLAGGGLASPAQAQLKTPGQIQRDINTAVKKATSNIEQVATAAKPAAASPCDFNLFAALEAATVVQQIQACLAPIAQDVIQPFVTDTSAALQSATTAEDQPAINCLKPALAILQAAAGTPAQPNATPPVPASVPGPILIFQKYREFVLASGPANCKSWVQTTVAGALGGL